MASFQDAIYGNRIAQDVANVAPLATTYHSAAPTPLAAPMANVTPPPSNLAKAGTFFKDVGSSIGHVGAAATSWLGHQTANLIEAPIKFGADAGHLIVDNANINDINKNSELTDARVQSTIEQYKAGQITKQQYQQSLQNYAQDMNNLESQSNSLTQKTTVDAGQFVTNSIDTAATVVTILTAGVSGVALKSVGMQSAAKFLSSDAADATIFRGASRVATLAVDDRAFAALPETTQALLQRSVAEVVANTTVHLSSPQIARAAVVNLALKSPISFNYVSSSAQDLYRQLDNEQYGSAVRNVAINSLLILGGGPVGEALGYLKKGSQIAENKIFGQGSFIDEISKNTGDKSPDGIINYLKSLPEDIRKQYVQDLSSTAARNTIAAKGNPVQGAWRILNNMDALYPGVDWRSLSHQQIVEDMMTQARASRIASEAGRMQGIKNVVVGRFDRNERGSILAALTKDAGSPTSKLVNPKYVAAYAKKYSVTPALAEQQLLQTMVDTGKITAEQAAQGAIPLTKEAILQRWTAVKQQFPNAAFANNKNLDRQITALAETHGDNVTAFEKAFRGIQTQEIISSMPSSVKQELAKLGYIPIVPKNLENPFVEGDGKLVTKFGDNNLFTKAVPPMPVASTLGATLTHLGLSPQVSTGRVYELFQNKLVGKFRDAGVLEKESPTFTQQQQSDALYKQISSYAASPTRGGIKGVRPAITDMRQLTTKDIMAATGKGRYDAQRIRSAMRDAWLSIPLDVRGLGDRAVDINYKLNPTAGWYARVLGATRFSWNPFFQAKVLTKTESLVQLKSGGTWPTTLGTNKILGAIFPDKYKGIEDVRAALRQEGIFSSERGPVIAGEAAEFGGTSSAPLTHKLLSGQERAISALISVQADKAGLDATEFVRQFPGQARDTVQVVAAYDKSSGLVSSPLARTLNFAFFPYRFEAKVAQTMAEALGRTSPVTQMAVIRGLYNGSQWLKSPEGQVWYSQNSEAIGLLKYFTPVTTIATIAEAFGQKPDSVGQFGELGGLPFGFIPMLLDAEGITHGLTQSPYVNPKTGKTLPNYIPVTVKGHAIAAIQDMLGSLFTYPGTQAGLPSKTAFFHDLSTSLVAGHTSDFSKQTPQLTNPEQKSFAGAIQSLNGTAPVPTPPVPAPYLNVNVPAGTSPLQNLPQKPTSTSIKKKKKSEFTPALLSGQTTLGQL